MYHYPEEEDITADKDVKEQLPVKQHDHAMDAFRYPIYAMHLSRTMFSKRAPVSPKQNPIDTRIHVVDDLLKQGFDNDEYDW